MMYRSGLVPRGLAIFGLVGGPLIILMGVLVIFDVIDPGTNAGMAIQGLMTIPEAFWELSLGIYLIAKGYRRDAPVLAPDATVRVPDSPSALRHSR
jgi:hypothetical protein